MPQRLRISICSVLNDWLAGKQIASVASDRAPLRLHEFCARVYTTRTLEDFHSFKNFVVQAGHHFATFRKRNVLIPLRVIAEMADWPNPCESELTD